MWKARELRPGVHWVGALDPDRRLFDGLIPLPEGTSYNSYVVQGQDRTALVDTADPARAGEFFARLDSLALSRLDFVVANHAEQDHSGLIPQVLARYPRARVIATAKGRKMLQELLRIPAERIDAVEDGALLELGGHTLQFFHAPWVHWPETMLTYLQGEQILFSCDLFGAHLAAQDLFLRDEPRRIQAALRYYAEIMAPFRTQIRKHMDRLKDLPLRLIAPSHGSLHDDPEPILAAYRRWSASEPANKVLIAFISMHGSTKEMVDHLAEALVGHGLQLEVLNLEDPDVGRLAIELLDAATLVLAAPMVLAGPHPRAVHAAALVNALRPKLKHAAIIGSYGWGGRLAEPLAGLLDGLKLELLPGVLAQGAPDEQTMRALDALAAKIVERHAALGGRR